MNRLNDKMTKYFTSLIEKNNNSKDIPKPYSWDWIMSIVELVEKDPHAKSGVEFHFHDNYCRIEFITVNDENIHIQDKGADKKEAMLNCFLKFYQRFDKDANQFEMGSDLFLLDEE